MERTFTLIGPSTDSLVMLMCNPMMDFLQGYEGIICGTCSGVDSNANSAQYGRTKSLDCKACIAKFWQTTFVVLYIALQVALVLLLLRNFRRMEEIPDNVEELSDSSDGEQISPNPSVMIKVGLCANLQVPHKSE